MTIFGHEITHTNCFFVGEFTRDRSGFFFNYRQASFRTRLGLPAKAEFFRDTCNYSQTRPGYPQNSGPQNDRRSPHYISLYLGQSKNKYTLIFVHDRIYNSTTEFTILSQTIILQGWVSYVCHCSIFMMGLFFNAASCRAGI